MKSRWPRSRLKFLATFAAGDHITGERIRDTGEYPVYGGNGLRGYTDDFSHDGDVVLLGRQGALCGNVNYASGQFWASEHAVVVTPKPDVDVRWLGELLRAMNLRQYSISAAQPGLSVEFITNLETVHPPLATQKVIATYIDREANEIDELIRQKRRMMELLREKRAAVITRTVTNGLNRKADYEPSSLGWIERIPHTWEEPRLKQVIQVRDERSEFGDEELLTVSHLTGVTPRSEKKVYMFKSEDMTGYKKCCRGDLVVNTLWAFMGALGIAWQDGIVSPDYHVYKLSDTLLPKYVDLVCRSEPFKVQILRHSKGVWSSRLRLYPEEMLGMRFPFPPIEEQQQIIDFLGKTFQRDSALITELERSIVLLEERRTVLIAAAVNGEIPIEEMAA